ncbi:MAG: hypothetical protein OEV21_02885 [Thermoplasmata archaeon]|nr:hypothetical protein [Thermoplasmata archaeon]
MATMICSSKMTSTRKKKDSISYIGIKNVKENQIKNKARIMKGKLPMIER